MKLSLRRPQLLLSAVAAAVALAGLTVAAAPAYAAGPHITAIGGPGEILVQGGGFNADARVRLVVLTSDLGKVLETIYVQANWIGYLNSDVYLDNLGGYIGNVWVAADGAPGPTAWARTAVSRAPVLWALNSAPVCEGTVYVGGSYFPPGAWVRLILVANAQVVDTLEVTVTWAGRIEDGTGDYAMPLPPGYSDGVIVVAEEFDPYGPQIWAVVGQAC